MPGKIHSYLPAPHDGADLLCRKEVGSFHSIMIKNHLDDVFGTDPARGVVMAEIEKFIESSLGHFKGKGGMMQPGNVDHSVEGAFELLQELDAVETDIPEALYDDAFAFQPAFQTGIANVLGVAKELHLVVRQNSLTNGIVFGGSIS